MAVQHKVMTYFQKSEIKKLTPIKSIRLKCLDCSGWSAHEVRLCVIKECALYPYRFGKNPSLEGKGGNVANLIKDSA